MKLLSDITPKDLKVNPIWRYEGEIDEHATVEPDKSLRDDGSGAWIAKTTFTLADGTVLPGYCSPMDDGIDYVQPVMLAGPGRVPVFSETAPAGVDAAAVCQGLGKTASEVFPIGFTCAVPLPDGSSLRGIITPGGLRRTT